MADGPGSMAPEQWASLAAAASADRPASGRSGVVALVLGAGPVGLDIRDGRVVGAVDPAQAGVKLPLSDSQLAGVLDGSLSLAQGFMRGDLKPEGATGPLLALIELFEDPEFRQRLAATTS